MLSFVGYFSSLNTLMSRTNFWYQSYYKAIVEGIKWSIFPQQPLHLHIQLFSILSSFLMMIEISQIKFINIQDIHNSIAKNPSNFLENNQFNSLNRLNSNWIGHNKKGSPKSNSIYATVNKLILTTMEGYQTF